MENTEQVINYQDYEANSEEAGAVKEFLNNNPTLPLTNEQKVKLLEDVDNGNGETETFDGGQLGDGHSFCYTYRIEGSDIIIGLDMTYSSWNGYYFNGGVGLVKYEKVTYTVPKIIK